jgi:phosphatidylglycerophosphatase A
LIRQVKKLITTFFYLGYIPLAPGTFGSIAGLLIYIILRHNIYLLTAAATLTVALGFCLSGQVAKLFNRQDPQQIVIDEISGMLISFSGLPNGLQAVPAGCPLFSGFSGIDWPWLIAGFAIFRILDIVKPFPANRFQAQGGSLGIMGDDIVAGIYTNLILRAWLMFTVGGL